MGKYVVHLFITTLLTMAMIYVIKKAAKKVDVPVINNFVETV